jgi:uncharacterized protein (DUF924 family)
MNEKDVERSEAILDFWFGSLDAEGNPLPENMKRWWTKDPAFDARISREFGADLERAARGELDAWTDTARSRLALIILLDQFSRNVYRETLVAFANDPRALAVALEGIERGHDRELSPTGRNFMYMPLMHAEDREVQERCVETFTRAVEEAGDLFRNGLDFAIRHRDIVARFGRFPHRNRILGRESTPEELEFLTQPGSSF